MALEGQVRSFQGRIEALQQELEDTKTSSRQKVDMLQQQLSSSSAGQDDTRRKMRAYVEQLSNEKETVASESAKARADLREAKEQMEIQTRKIQQLQQREEQLVAQQAEQVSSPSIIRSVSFGTIA